MHIKCLSNIALTELYIHQSWNRAISEFNKYINQLKFTMDGYGCFHTVCCSATSTWMYISWQHIIQTKLKTYQMFISIQHIQHGGHGFFPLMFIN